MWQEHCEEKNNFNMAHWLVEQLMNKTCPGLKMLPDDERTFQIPWWNRKSGGLRPGGDDTQFIIAWARHKKYAGRDENENDLSRWKEKFRNALNKCINIERVETSKNAYMVCKFTEDFFAKFKSSSSQSRKRVSSECLFQNKVMCVEDSPPSKKSNCISPGLGLKEYTPAELNSNRKNPVSVPSSSPHCTNPLPRCAPYDINTHSIQVEIVYGRREKRTVKSEILDPSTRLCRIGSFQVATLKDLLSEDGELGIQLPSLEDLKHLNFTRDERNVISNILKDMQRGVVLKQDSRNVFLQRRSIIKVYLSHGKYPAIPLSRSKNQKDFIKAFDMISFENDLNSYIQRKSPRRPKPGFILTVGHDIEETEHNPLESCYIYIHVTHLWAEKRVKESDSLYRIPNPPLCSGPDHLDMFISLARCGADPMPSFSAAHLADCAFSEITSLHQELSCFNQTQDIEETCVMAVEINSPFFDSRRVLVRESARSCRIFYGAVETQMSEDNFKEDNSIEVRLPDVNALNLIGASEAVRSEVDKMMKDLHRGVHLIYNKLSIYAERRTVLRVFHWAGSQSVKLKRRTMSEKPDPMNIFDFALFMQELKQHKTGDPLPRTSSILTIGHDIELGAENIVEGVYLHVKVTNLLAEQRLQNKLNASVRHSAMNYSLPDSMDETVRCLQSLSMH